MTTEQVAEMLLDLLDFSGPVRPEIYVDERRTEWPVWFLVLVVPPPDMSPN